MTRFARHLFLPRPAHVALYLILLASLALHFNHLGHPGIKDLDEAYHAIVARSMLDNPFRPTLYATPYLPYDYRDWQANSVWLHKPPVALWQIAGSFALFGESNFTLRLPSALLATAGVALTFLIGRSLISAEAGLVAALLQALSPAITRLVHGQVFSDHVDVAMLFWCELAIWLLIRAARSDQLVDAIFVGVAQAIAWMTKSYPALFVSGLAVVLCLARSWMGDADDPRRLRFSPRHLIAFTLAAMLTAAPWIAWCLIEFPREFLFEQSHIVQHLYRNVEEFAAPWDRLLADYLQRGLLEWYALAIVAVFTLTVDAIVRRDSRRLFIAAWAWIVLLPHLLATSKTPTATLIGWPAAWLAIGALASDALQRRSFAIGALLAAALLLIVWPKLPGESVMGYGSGYRFGSIAAEHWPTFASAALIALAGLITWRASLPDASAAPPVPPMRQGPLPSNIAALIIIVFAFPIYRHASLAILTARDVPTDEIAFPKLGKLVRAKSPPNAVFLVDAQQRGEAIIAMWWLDRACYPLHEETLAADAATIAANGGEPFILSRRQRPESPLPGVAGEASIYVPAAMQSATRPATRS